MIMTRLTYFSRNRLGRLGGAVEDHLDDILIESVANNRRDDITGAMIHDDRWFAQVLEGGETVLSATFERILRDRRHSDVRLVRIQPVAARKFGPCWMARGSWSADTAELFRHYGESERFDPQLLLPERLGDLIEAVVSRTSQLPGRTPWTTRSATNAA
jgi:Sensors of blue-light using FAD